MITNFDNVDESRLSAEEQVQYSIAREFMRMGQKIIANSFYRATPSSVFYLPYNFEEYEKSTDKLKLDAIAKIGISIANEDSLYNLKPI